MDIDFGSWEVINTAVNDFFDVVLDYEHARIDLTPFIPLLTIRYGEPPQFHPPSWSWFAPHRLIKYLPRLQKFLTGRGYQVSIGGQVTFGMRSIHIKPPQAWIDAKRQEHMETWQSGRLLRS